MPSLPAPGTTPNPCQNALLSPNIFRIPAINLSPPGSDTHKLQVRRQDPPLEMTSRPAPCALLSLMSASPCHHIFTQSPCVAVWAAVLGTPKHPGQVHFGRACVLLQVHSTRKVRSAAQLQALASEARIPGVRAWQPGSQRILYRTSLPISLLNKAPRQVTPHTKLAEKRPSPPLPTNYPAIKALHATKSTCGSQQAIRSV